MRPLDIFIPEARIDRLTTAVTTALIEKTLDQEPLTFLVVANAAIHFASDVLRKYADLTSDKPVYTELVQVQSYDTNTNCKRKPRLLLPPPYSKVSAHNVVILDTICSSGQTLEVIKQAVNEWKPLSITTCVLLCKDKYSPDIVGQYISTDLFLVGYGLDNYGKSRNLRDIYFANNL